MPEFPLIDSHVHLWDPARLLYPWLADAPRLHRRHDLDAFDAARAGVNVEAIVFVECTGAMDDAVSRKEVAWVQDLATADARIQGIVAHASVEQGAAVREHLAWLAAQPLVKGVRRLIQHEPDPRFCLKAEFVEGVRLLAAFDLTFDICIFHHQVPSAVELVRSCPEVSFVLDHLGKPPIREGRLDPWRDELRAMAALPNVVCKLSGVVTEADPDGWTAADVRPYMDHAIDTFGGGRLLFGGDWPVLNLAGDYPTWVRLVDEAAQDASDADRRRLFRANAERVYRLVERET